MSTSNCKTQYFRKSYPRHYIISKVLRYLLESEILRRSETHAFTRRQLAIFAYDYISTQIILDGLYESEELELLTQWLTSFSSNNIFNGIAVDVGANIGNHSLYFSDFFSEVLAFEPHPLTFKLLSINSELADNVKCFNFGLSCSDGQATINVDSRNMSGACVARSGNSMSPQIQLKTLDSILTETIGKPVRLIKIDVEGHESEVLAGAEATIRRHQPVIIFEQHVSDFSGGSSCAIDLIRSYGYENFACMEMFPQMPAKLPRALWPIYAIIARSLVGASRRVIGLSKFTPKFYPFIVAIPGWLYEQATDSMSLAR